jgi:hypothetical protein
MERIRMKTKRSATWGLLAGAVACAAVAAMPGCELLVDFDRSKIPGVDGSLGDDVSESPDAPASSDAASDGSVLGEGGPDATSPDAGLDGGDTGASSPPDSGGSDTGADAPNEVGPGSEAGPEAGPDANIDAGD